MNPLRTAAVLLALYGAAVLGNAVFYASWSGDSSELVRAVIRAAGMAVIALALLQGWRWAWWAGVVVAGAFGVFGVVGLLAARASGFFAARPYPAADYAFFGISIAALLGAFGVLVSRKGRSALRPAA